MRVQALLQWASAECCVRFSDAWSQIPSPSSVTEAACRVYLQGAGCVPSLPCLVVAKAGLAHTLHWKKLVETNFALLCSMVSAAWLIHQAASGIGCLCCSRFAANAFIVARWRVRGVFARRGCLACLCLKRDALWVRTQLRHVADAAWQSVYRTGLLTCMCC